MKKTFDFGKIAYNNGSRKMNLVTVDVSLELKKQGKLTTDLQSITEYYAFSASGSIWNHIKSDILSGGQNLDEINETVKGHNPTFKKIYAFWKKYHLNDLKAGTRAQSEAVEKYFAEKNLKYDYSEACDYLKSIDLFEDRGYKYGHDWLVELIPVEDVKTIQGLLS